MKEEDFSKEIVVGSVVSHDGVKTMTHYEFKNFPIICPLFHIEKPFKIEDEKLE